MEEWRPVVGFEGLYEVSNLGNVRSLDRTIVRSDGVVQSRSGRLLIPFKNNDGYLESKLSCGGVSRRYGIHRLVAMAFIPNPDGLEEVNHLDAVRDNNIVDNLEWCSHGDNVRYAISQGRHFCTRDLTGKNNPNYHNHALHDIYAANRQLAVEKLGRPGSQNGKAHPITCIFPGGESVSFSWIGECASELRNRGLTTASDNTIRTNILMSRKRNGTYLGCRFTD